MGKTTTKSASEAADALGYMALAGWDKDQMKKKQYTPYCDCLKLVIWI